MASLAWNCFDISVQNVINIGKNHAKYFERTYVIQSTFFIHKFCVQPQEKSLSVSIKVRMLLHFYYVKTFDLHCIIYCVVNTTSICQHSVFLRQTIYKCSWAFRLKTCRFRGGGVYMNIYLHWNSCSRFWCGKKKWGDPLHEHTLNIKGSFILSSFHEPISYRVMSIDF